MNTEALEDSWRHHAAGVRRLVRDLLGDPHDADDVAQETWLTALRHPPRAGWTLRAWLAGIAANRTRFFVRSEQRRRAHEERARTDACVDDNPALERFEQIELVVEALRKLSARNREIVLLRYYEDLMPAAIAARLALPVATVKTRLRRSLAQLRRRLEGRAFPAWAWLGGTAVSWNLKVAVPVALASIAVPAGIVWWSRAEAPSSPPAPIAFDAVDERQGAAPADLGFAQRAATPDANAALASAEGTPDLGANDAGASTRPSSSAMRVRVVDPRGVALEGVPVVLRQLRDGAWHYLASAETDASTARLARIPFDPSWQRESETRLLVNLPIHPLPSIAIDSGRPPRDVLELAVPALARGTFRIATPEGIPSPPLVDLVLTCRSPWIAESASEPLSVTALQRQISGGEVKSLWIGMPGPYSYELRDRSQRHDTGKGELPAELVAGENGPFDLLLGPLRPIAVVHLRDEAELPFASAGVNAHVAVIRANETSSMGGQQSTDEEGVVRIPLLEPYKPGTSRELRFLGFPDRRSDFGHAMSWNEQKDTIQATLEISFDLPPGENDLGVLVLRSNREPVLAAGIVLDGDGNPFGDVHLTLDRRHDAVDGTGWMHRSWSNTAFTTRSRSDGSFTFRGQGDFEAIRVFAESPGTVQLELPVHAKGRGDLRIEMHRSASVAGRLVVPQGLQQIRIRALESWWTEWRVDRAAREDEMDLVRRGEKWADFDQQQGFVIAGVRPGRARVEVLVQEVPIAAWEVDLGKGVTCRDPRLDPIDLAHYVRELRVVLHRPDGTPLGSTEVLFQNADEKSTGARQLMTSPNGELRAWNATELTAFELEAPGFERVHVDWSAELRKFTLQAR